MWDIWGLRERTERGFRWVNFIHMSDRWSRLDLSHFSMGRLRSKWGCLRFGWNNAHLLCCRNMFSDWETRVVIGLLDLSISQVARWFHSIWFDLHYDPITFHALRFRTIHIWSHRYLHIIILEISLNHLKHLFGCSPWRFLLLWLMFLIETNLSPNRSDMNPLWSGIKCLLK